MSRWSELWEAITAMQVGDPPLRWTISRQEYRSLSLITSNWAKRKRIPVRTFYYDGDLWIVRLPMRKAA